MLLITTLSSIPSTIPSDSVSPDYSFEYMEEVTEWNTSRHWRNEECQASEVSCIVYRYHPLLNPQKKEKQNLSLGMSHEVILFVSDFACILHPLSHADKSCPLQYWVQEFLGNGGREWEREDEVDSATILAAQGPSHSHELTRISYHSVRIPPAWHTWCHPEYGDWEGLCGREGNSDMLHWGQGGHRDSGFLEAWITSTTLVDSDDLDLLVSWLHQLPCWLLLYNFNSCWLILDYPDCHVG